MISKALKGGLLLHCLFVFSLFWIESRGRRLRLCPKRSPHSNGNFSADMSEETLQSVQSRFFSVLQDVLQSGGYYKPIECIARQRVAIIVPCRNRDGHIPIFLKNIHPFLMRQQIEYQIYIIFQTDRFRFNRGALFNVGYNEAMKERNWDCVIFHDIDTIPTNDDNLYKCPVENPIHLAAEVEKQGYR